MKTVGEPLSPARATEQIRATARGDPRLDWTRHAKDQMAARDLTVLDVLYVLKNGFVHEPGVPATALGFFKYEVEGGTPNTNNRLVRVVVIPGPNELKFVTVMWKDEPLISG